MPISMATITLLMMSALVTAKEQVQFVNRDGWVIHADLYGTGE